MALQELNIEDIKITSVVSLTDNASSRVKNLLGERNLEGYGLRVFVSGGGCSGMQYGMGLDAEAREFDTIVETGGVKVFIDPTSVMYLEGSVIDFEDNLMGGGFRVDNPQAVASCGCGHSFRTEGSSASPDDGGLCGPDGC